MTKQFQTTRWQLTGRKPGTFSQWHVIDGRDWTLCQRGIPFLVNGENETATDQPPTCKLCLKRLEIANR